MSFRISYFIEVFTKSCFDSSFGLSNILFPTVFSISCQNINNFYRMSICVNCVCDAKQLNRLLLTDDVMVDLQHKGFNHYTLYHHLLIVGRLYGFTYLRRTGFLKALYSSKIVIFFYPKTRN